MTDYIQVMLNAVFTGLGAAIGYGLYDLYVKKRMKRLDHHKTRLTKRLKHLWEMFKELFNPGFKV